MPKGTGVHVRSQGERDCEKIGGLGHLFTAKDTKDTEDRALYRNFRLCVLVAKASNVDFFTGPSGAVRGQDPPR
jgi:hypothetical protein